MEHTAAAPYLSIVIPVYNEEQRIGAFLPGVIAYASAQPFAVEIVIADDGSLDRTVEVTTGLLAAYPADLWRIVRLPRNRGKGGALQEGMLAAGGAYILFIDADGSTAITELDRFVPLFGDSTDLYVAVRTIKHAAPLKRRFFGKGYIRLANMLLGLHQADFTCGFKCYRREAARQVFSRQTLDNWSFDAEDLFVAHQLGLRMVEVPVYWRHIAGSKVRVVRNVIECGFDLLRIRWRQLCGRYR